MSCQLTYLGDCIFLVLNRLNLCVLCVTKHYSCVFDYSKYGAILLMRLACSGSFIVSLVANAVRLTALACAIANSASLDISADSYDGPFC